MTKLIFFKNGEHYIGFSCKDHSGYAQEGYDIVCAAISSAVQITAAYLEKFFTQDIKLTVDEQNALIEVKCNGFFLEADRQISILEDFVKELSTQYSDYITFDYLEV